MIGKVVLAPVSVIVARVLVQVAETAAAAKDVLIEQGKFRELAAYLEKIRPLLLELQEKNFKDAAPLMVALDALEREIKRAQVLMADCTSKSRIYLLLNCRSIVKQVEDVTHQIGHCLRRIPMASMNLSLETREHTTRLFKEMQGARFKASLEEDQILTKIESRLKIQQADSNFANQLLLEIAKAVGTSVDPRSLKKELMEFKKQADEIALEKKEAEAIQLEQIIGILNASHAAADMHEEEVAYRRKKEAGGTHLLPALQSFLCPITQEIMEEPAEIASGQTFERNAILKWFAAGNNTCPTTKVELPSLDVRPNLALRNSIEEWKERNTVISIAATRPGLLSESQDEVHDALAELLRISEEKHLHKYWIASEGLIPEVVRLLTSVKERHTRRKSLAVLSSLADVDENKETIAREGALPPIVRSLARDVGESRLAVGLLLKLSTIPEILSELAKVQGCILLLVTMLRSEDKTAVEDARRLLMNLAEDDNNVILMAESNYFQPMVSRLAQGPKTAKVLMATSLATLKLADGSTATVGGAIGPLVNLLNAGESAALGALENLSTIPKNREQMITAGAIPPLLRLLCTISSAVMTLKAQAASTLANIALWEATPESPAVKNFSYLQSEEAISQVLGLINLGDQLIQGHLLRALCALCSREPGLAVRKMLRCGGATQLMVQFMQESVSDADIQTSSVKLLFLLSGDGAGKELASHLTHPFLKALLTVISATEDCEARAAALGILGNLPQGDPDVLAQVLQADVLATVASLLSARSAAQGKHKVIVENAVGALMLFSSPSSLEAQARAADYGVIPQLVELLVTGTPLAKARAAAALGHFSESSGRLSTRVSNSTGFCCFAQPQEAVCVVHGGKCSVKSSFCLVEAAAIEPLVHMLSEQEAILPEAALGALSTLVYDEGRGVRVIANMKGVKPVVRLLTTGSSDAKEKAVWLLEKFFRFDEYKQEYSGAAQMPLIDLAQRGSPSARQVAAKILAHLNFLHNQSSYF